MTDSNKHILFLSYAGIDRPSAGALAKRIESTPEAKKVGLKVWFDRRSLVPGKSWQSQIEEAIDKRSTSFAVYIGSEGIVNWVEREVQVAVDRATRDKTYETILDSIQSK